MRRFVDLHTHSCISDGQLAPAEVVHLAETKKLAALALTDHDTVAGLTEAAAEAEKYPNLKFVPGIEISAIFPGGTLHILGLGIDADSAELGKLMDRLIDARNERNPKIIDKLRGLGVDITMDDVLAERPGRSGGTKPMLGRLHIAHTLLRKGVVRNIGEAFAKYIGDGAPAFVDKERFQPVEAIRAIHDADGVAVLAHPPQLNYANRAQLERIVRGLIRDGLDGLEVYHSDHSPQQTREYLDMARRFDLGVTGGSDFHGAAKPEVKLGRPPTPLAAIDEEFAEKLFARS